MFKPLAIGKQESLTLDLLRALAAQAVLLGHGLSFATNGTSFLGDRYSIQELGVVIFFVLSGYLICSTTRTKIDANHSYSFAAFFIERFARIYVTYIPCLLIIAALDGMNYALPGYGHRDAFNLITFVGNLLMLQDSPAFIISPQLSITSFGSGRPLWTLAVDDRICTITASLNRTSHATARSRRGESSQAHHAPQRPRRWPMRRNRHVQDCCRDPRHVGLVVALVDGQADQVPDHIRGSRVPIGIMLGIRP